MARAVVVKEWPQATAPYPLKITGQRLDSLAPLPESILTLSSLPTPHFHWVNDLQGCVVIFLSNFLALLVKVNATGEGNQETLGGLMVAVNILLVLAVLCTSWFSAQQTVDDSRGNDSVFATAKDMVTIDRLSSTTVLVSQDPTASESSAASSSVGPAVDARILQTKSAAVGVHLYSPMGNT